MNTPYTHLPLISPLYRTIRRGYRRLKYAGDKVNCPLCGKKFTSWVNHLENGSCPECDSATRHRLLWLFLEKYADILRQGGKLLHFAPERCLKKRFRALSHIDYTTVDISAPGVDYHTDITDLVFQDNTFDAIICSHVLEHIPNDIVAMQELYRVLLPNGIAYIQVPYRRHRQTDEDLSVTDPTEREKRFGQFDHVRVYGTDFQERLEGVGFQVSVEYFAQELPTEVWKCYGLWDDVIFCCRKSP
ncbi:class I SAM-dependent methyltransferase [Mastigocoleus testarum]|uniref:Methyltransferase type 11 domain-containing protein n=1 Tax=Mastigocoleus testarum BC008 TaxID=371196 RepID=A0A0V7ZE10_9CYAN|nr:class I SAM-dependent methyltransferase [Mastigocoleus testarum]KST62711.1 hypothetical protein BC008_38450 [Mastigocoleus testarum BC008]